MIERGVSKPSTRAFTAASAPGLSHLSSRPATKRQPARSHRADARSRAGELGSEDPFLTLHLDRCLGCRRLRAGVPVRRRLGRGLRSRPPAHRPRRAGCRRWRAPPCGRSRRRGLAGSVRPRAAVPSHRRAGPASRLGEVAVRHGNAGGDAASATRNAELERATDHSSASRVPTSALLLPRLHHGRPLRPRPRRHNPDARGERLRGVRGGRAGVLRRVARPRRAAGRGAPAREVNVLASGTGGTDQS